jgi:hypothetical protein
LISVDYNKNDIILRVKEKILEFEERLVLDLDKMGIYSEEKKIN